VVITGDIAAQQAIRFNIFQLNCTYTGADSGLNIGPKGFTGEKYGGGTYWDTEACCLYFYLGTQQSGVARQLLMYRYLQLGKARENAAKLGLRGALYPMVTMNGEECHNEWEITFEEIHRNAAIAHAVGYYTQYTGDRSYLEEYGIDVLAEIARFWASRVSYSDDKRAYVILGVTGPNEYENNVNNNWYTNRMAQWCLSYAAGCLRRMARDKKMLYAQVLLRLGLTEAETGRWEEIAGNIYLPYDAIRGIHLQQDGYLDKELMPASRLDPSELPLNRHWSWDRILRSCFIKQADVLQGLWFLNDDFTVEEKRRDYDFYEPMTLHESSLSACIHSILACEVGERGRAYELYLRTARLDLDDVNRDTGDGLHITSMSGTWMSIVYGFGGVRVRDGVLCMNPFLPGCWREYAFSLVFRKGLLRITVGQSGFSVKNTGDGPVTIKYGSGTADIGPNEQKTFCLEVL
ncbi:MAG: glycosyl hydrolase family 65 protein, partial [Clostridia bacterium]|nr:glycosyl hydrolase family 65 protein [Clostridia bacterium]